MVIDNEEQKEKKYASNVNLDTLICQAVESVNAGSPLEMLTTMIKTAPTGILAPSSEHAEARYRPGNKLVTYKAMDITGKPVQETYGGGVAEITGDSVILRNAAPIKYPEDHPLAGTEVKGTYATDGTFRVDQERGTTTLYNEYVSDTTFVKGAYGIDAKTTWQTGFKLDKSYVMEIPKEVGDVKVFVPGAEIDVTSGDYVVIDTKKDKVFAVQAIEKTWLGNTYTPMKDYLAKLAE